MFQFTKQGSPTILACKKKKNFRLASIHISTHRALAIFMLALTRQNLPLKQLSFESQSRSLLHATFDWTLSLHTNIRLNNGLLYACLESQSSDLLEASFDWTRATCTQGSIEYWLLHASRHKAIASCSFPSI